MDFPQEFCRRMEHLLGEEAKSFFDSLTKEPCRALRWDPEKITEEELSALLGSDLGEKIPFAPFAAYYTGDGIGHSPLHCGGALYVQDPAAMAPVCALPKREYHRILDLCAAPGGKSLQACESLSSDGVIFCNEPSPVRRAALMQNLERFGEGRARVTGLDATSLPAEWEGKFDLVLCDAPCSGEGMMRKHERALSEWSVENVLLCAERQKKLLESAYRALAPGGILLYSTCTWAVEENEENLAELLEAHPDLVLTPPREEILPVSRPALRTKGMDLSAARRFYPHVFRGEGQFFAILQKGGCADTARSAAESENPSPRERKKKSPRPDPELSAVQAFLAEVLENPPRGEILCRQGEYYDAVRDFFPAEKTVSPGVLIGRVQKGRVIPHHRFFLAYAASFRRKVALSLTDERVSAYLRGEEILLPHEADGLAVLFCGRIPLGGVRLRGGRGKNLYPKGLRIP
ncbi:MAG: hypothetical protein IKD31_02155 [Clostridia bacterium]|nr:hypothetical protein [Clostridia bacterium]